VDAGVDVSYKDRRHAGRKRGARKVCLRAGMSENSGSLRRGQRRAKETAQLEQICDRPPNLCC